MINISNTEHWLKEISSKCHNKIAFITNNHTFTFEQFAVNAVSAADFLKTNGVSEGENVCLLGKHDYKFWILVNALWFIGAVPVPLNSRHTEKEIEWQMQKVNSKFLINTADNKSYSSTFNIFYGDFGNTNPIRNLNTFHSVMFNESRSALILFTSGTTGKPKAVVHTFRNMLESVKAVDNCFHLNKQDIWLASLPLYHIGGFMILVRSLVSESRLAFPISLKYESLVEGLEYFNPTHISLVTTILNQLLENGIKPNKNLKYLFLGGGPLSKSTCSQAMHAGFPIVKVYGTSETCSMVCALKPEEFFIKPDSAGRPLADSIVISKAKKEIIISSPTLFKEYFDDNDKSKQRKVNDIYNTGDLGWLDDDGYLYIESRREDIVITGGENVSIKEVEEAIYSLHKVDDCFVFGIADKKWGQLLCAAITAKNIKEEQLRTELKTILASYKIPKMFFFVNEIPRNEMGKVKKNDLLNLLKIDEV